MSVVETDVKIKLNSTIIPTDGESEKYEMWLSGTFIKKSGKTYLRYVEELEEKRFVQRLNLAISKLLFYVVVE